jgi:hypothetical protein
MPSGLPIEEITVRLPALQSKYPRAIVHRGSANKWEIWPPREQKPSDGIRRPSTERRVSRTRRIRHSIGLPRRAAWKLGATMDAQAVDVAVGDHVPVAATRMAAAEDRKHFDERSDGPSPFAPAH